MEDSFNGENIGETKALKMKELRKLLAEYILAEGEDKSFLFEQLLSRGGSGMEIRYIARLLQNSLLIGVGEARVVQVLHQLLNEGNLFLSYLF